MNSVQLTRLLSLGLLLSPTACPGDDTSNDETDTAADTGSTSGDTNDPTTATATATETGATTTSTTGSSGEDTTSGSSGDTGSDTSSSGSEGSSSSSGGSSGTTGMNAACDGEEVLLYEQASAAGKAGGAPAGSDDAQFVRVADDFEIEPGDQCWCVTRVVLQGQFANSMLSNDLEVGFYEDDGGLPSNPAVAIESGMPTDTDGVFDYTLEAPVVLTAGTHWLSAMPTIPSLPDGIWFWLGASGEFGSVWSMESDFAPFVPTCEAWTDGANCYPDQGTDLAFEIHGVVGGDNCM